MLGEGRYWRVGSRLVRISVSRDGGMDGRSRTILL